MSDESQLAIKSDDAGSSLILARGQSSLVARGFRDAEALLLGGPLSELRRLAEDGDSDAQYELGKAYKEGDGVPQNLAEAARWFLKSAEQSHLYANFNLSEMYRSGEGVTVDRRASRRYSFGAADIAIDDPEQWDSDWLVWAIDYGAVNGHARAQLVAGRWSAEGRAGREQDPVTALMWYILAASLGGAVNQEELAGLRAKIASDMTPSQIAEAEREAEKWRIRHIRLLAEEGDDDA